MEFGGTSRSGLIKEQLADLLREEILQGRLAPGESIVEIRWAKKLGVGQASVREAINLLTAEGFVEKLSGQSARVTKLSVDDLAEIHILRTELEGLAIRLLTENPPDLSDLEEAYADMASAAQYGKMRSIIDRDLRFHLLIFEKAGNRFLLEAGRRILVPLFAFTLVRVMAKEIGPETFVAGLKDHARILDVIRSGDTDAADRHVRSAMRRFAELGRNTFVD